MFIVKKKTLQFIIIKSKWVKTFIGEVAPWVWCIIVLWSLYTNFSGTIATEWLHPDTREFLQHRTNSWVAQSRQYPSPHSSLNVVAREWGHGQNSAMILQSPAGGTTSGVAVNCPSIQLHPQDWGQSKSFMATITSTPLGSRAEHSSTGPEDWTIPYRDL